MVRVVVRDNGGKNQSKAFTGAIAARMAKSIVSKSLDTKLTIRCKIPGEETESFKG